MRLYFIHQALVGLTIFGAGVVAEVPDAQGRRLIEDGKAVEVPETVEAEPPPPDDPEPVESIEPADDQVVEQIPVVEAAPDAPAGDDPADAPPLPPPPANVETAPGRRRGRPSGEAA